MELFKSQLATLSEDGLLLLLQDATNRIGTHVGMSEEPDENYVTKQQSIINMVKDELERRRKAAQ